MTQGNNNQGVDNAADTALNKGIDSAAQHVPEGQKVDQAAKQKADQTANNDINQEANKGASGVEKDVKDHL